MSVFGSEVGVRCWWKKKRRSGAKERNFTEAGETRVTKAQNGSNYYKFTLRKEQLAE